MEGANNYVLQDAYKKLKNSEPLENYERAALERFTDTFVTCTRCVTVAGEEAVRIAEEVNWHSHSNSCKKGGRRTCRWKFPRFPLARTIFVDANSEDHGPRMDAKEREEILDRVMAVLVEESGGQKVLSKNVKDIMLSKRYPNVKKINEDQSQPEEGEEVAFDERKSSKFNERENSQHSLPKTPSPRHYYPEDPSSQDSPLETTWDPRDYFPEEFLPFEARSTSPQSPVEDPSASNQFNERENSKFDEEDETTWDPHHYIPEQFLPPSTTFEARSPSQHSPLEDPSASSHFNERKSSQNIAKKKSEASPQADTRPSSMKTKRKQNTGSYVKMESPEEYKRNIRRRIEEVLKIASAGGTPITYERYEQAVIEQPRKGSEVLLQRDIDEIFVNNYNAEWIVNWNANIDLSPVYDYYGTITYVTDYFTKDSTGLTEVLKTAMKQLSEEKDMREKCNEMANLFLTHRQVGECEAIYKLFANMNMTYSSIATIFVPTEPKGHRRQFLQRQDPESGQGFKVDGREGLFMEKQDLISKYERRKLLPKKGEEEEILEQSEAAKTLDQLSFCQYIKIYESKGWQQKTNEEGEAEEGDDDEDRPEEGQLAVEDDFNYLIGGSSEAPRRKLPQLLTLQDPLPGEPKILHKRTFPRALRFFKKRHDKNPHLYYFTELMLYHPFRDENELFPEDPQKCEELYEKHKKEIQYVKAQVMPFLESVEEAQVIYEQMRANEEEEDIEDKMGADLDPEMEQEIADGDDLDDEEHPDYYHIDPNQLDVNPDEETGTRRVFKTIVLPNKDTQVILI